MSRRRRQKYTLVAVGDKADFDSFKRLHSRKGDFSNSRVKYQAVSYDELLNGEVPAVETGVVMIFFFFPFVYWNRYIEPRRYRGVYGSKEFYRKFNDFFRRVERSVRTNYRKKEIRYINPPRLCAKYRDKLFVKRILATNKVPTPKLYRIKSTKHAYEHLSSGRSFYIKPRYGSMGKGITHISPARWRTNFIYRDNRIMCRRSDYGWKFREVSKKRAFLEKLIRNDFYVEEAVDISLLNNKKFDLRVYVFFGKVLFIYPKTNTADSVTTNISQDGTGEYPAFIRPVPKPLLRQIRKKAVVSVKSAGLNFAGVDLVVDSSFKQAYVLDLNVFPGFPRKRIYNLARHITEQLKKVPV